LVTCLADQAGRALAPGAYLSFDWLASDHEVGTATVLISLLRALTFTNEVWMHSSTFGSNHAYWSLGFEVPYYIAFGIMVFSKGTLRLCGVGLWLLCVGPEIALFFLLWLAGVLCYRLQRDPIPLPNWAAWGLTLVIIPVYGIVKLGFRGWKLPIYDPGALLPSALSFGYYMAIGIAVVCNIIGMAVLLRDRAAMSPAMTRAIRWVAGGTFSLYLMHQPLMVLGKVVVDRLGGGALPAAGATVLVLVACYLLAEIGERRKHLIRGFLLRLRAKV
jgi:peptidoglycan/LPS O-acetylase OafA/YrhL